MNTAVARERTFSTRREFCRTEIDIERFTLFHTGHKDKGVASVVHSIGTAFRFRPLRFPAPDALRRSGAPPAGWAPARRGRAVRDARRAPAWWTWQQLRCLRNPDGWW